MKLSLFTKIFGDREFEGAVSEAADAGYDGVEPMGREPHLAPETSRERAEEMAAAVDEHGLEVPCLASYTGGYVDADDEERQAELDALERFLELTDVFDCDLVRHSPGGPSPHRADEEDWEVAAEWMEKAADLAADYDARLGVEIHSNKLIESADDAVRLFETVDRDNVGAIHDAGNMFIAGEEFGPDSIETLGDRLFHVHAKDIAADDDGPIPYEGADGEVNRFDHALMNEGDVDHAPIVSKLREVGYDGHLTFECHADLDAREIADHELAAGREMVENA